MALLVVHGAMLHALLLASTFLYLHGVIGGGALVLAQVANAGLLLAIPLCAEKWRNGVLAGRKGHTAG